MYGLKIKHDHVGLAVALRNGAVCCFVENIVGDCRIKVNGCDQQGQGYEWYEYKLYEGDYIEISVENIAEQEVSTARIYDFSKPEDRRSKLIESYKLLKQELIEEGLL